MNEIRVCTAFTQKGTKCINKLKSTNNTGLCRIHYKMSPTTNIVIYNDQCKDVPDEIWSLVFSWIDKCIVVQLLCTISKSVYRLVRLFRDNIFKNIIVEKYPL